MDLEALKQEKEQNSPREAPDKPNGEMAMSVNVHISGNVLQASGTSESARRTHQVEIEGQEAIWTSWRHWVTLKQI